jgi:hypothetical protein
MRLARRVVSYTNAEGEIYIGAARLDPQGDMVESPDYFPSFAWRTTAIIDGKLMKFWAVANEEGLRVFQKVIPDHNRNATFAGVNWGAAMPEANF